MEFNELLINKNLTIYKLSKISNIAKSTLFDIASGKSNIYDCTGRTLLKLSKALPIPSPTPIFSNTNLLFYLL